MKENSMMKKVKWICKYLTKANNNNVKNVMKKLKQGSYRAELYFKAAIPKLLAPGTSCVVYNYFVD